MKKFFIILMLALIGKVNAQSTNDALNLLVANKSISQEQADSIRADAAIKQQETDAGKKSFWLAAAREMQLTGYTQIRYQILDEANKNNGFDIRRARLDLRGNLTPYFGYRLQTEFVDKAKILDAYAWSRLQAFYSFREEEGNAVNNNYFSLQYQIGF